MEKNFIISDSQGLNNRVATVLVNTASRFTSDIFLSFGGREVNLKSIMGVMSLGIPQGSQITITSEGSDAEDALVALEKILYATDTSD